MVLVTVFTFLALFSILSIVLSARDPRPVRDPRDNLLLLETLARR